MLVRKRSILYSSVVGLLIFASSSLMAGAQAPAAPSSTVTVLPDSPGALKAANESQPAMLFVLSSSRYESPQQQSSQAAQQPAQQPGQTSNVSQKPVGTAAAEAPSANGISASQPAGVAIAPAKQHRVRTLILRTGAIIGAGVAIGTVIALSEATSSKPPGAH